MIWNRFYAPFLAISLFLCSCSKAGRKTNDKSLFVVETLEQLDNVDKAIEGYIHKALAKSKI